MYYYFICYVKNIIYLFTLQVDTERNVSSLLLEKVLIVLYDLRLYFIRLIHLCC